VRYAALSIFVLVLAASSDVRAQGANTPLPLAPGAQRGPATTPNARVNVPNNWKIITGQPDPLTGQISRVAGTSPKSNPVLDGKSVTTGLLLRCDTDLKGLQLPDVIVVFTSLTGVGHFKNFAARYRFDEGPVRDFAANSIIGKNHARIIFLPNVVSLADVGNPPKNAMPAGVVNPGIEIAGAARLRIEFNFKSAGTTFLDFNVSGATQAISALGCQ
jgi:hypothetical protein